MIQGEYVLPFPDRRTAGILLAELLIRTVVLDEWAERTAVLALPRGGVAVAKQVAAVLGVPMNVIVTRKIGYPRQPELGVGAIAEGLGSAVYDAACSASCRFPRPTWRRWSPPRRPNWPGKYRYTGAAARCRGWPDGA